MQWSGLIGISQLLHTTVNNISGFALPPIPNPF